MQNVRPSFFPVIESFIGGVRLLWAHKRLFAMLSAFPFGLTLATAVLMRLFADNIPLFLMPIAQLPSSLIIGIECGIVLRFLVLNEHPTLVDETSQGVRRNHAIMKSGIVYAGVTYLAAGLFVFLMKIQAAMQDIAPEQTGGYVPVMVLLVVGALWAARYFWLHIPVALDFDMRQMYAQVGRWGGSLRIFGLFLLCSMVANMVLSVFVLVVQAALQPISMGLAQAFSDAGMALSSVLLALVFTCASVVALESLNGKTRFVRRLNED